MLVTHHGLVDGLLEDPVELVDLVYLDVGSDLAVDHLALQQTILLAALQVGDELHRLCVVRISRGAVVEG